MLKIIIAINWLQGKNNCNNLLQGKIIANSLKMNFYQPLLRRTFFQDNQFILTMLNNSKLSLIWFILFPSLFLTQYFVTSSMPHFYAKFNVEWQKKRRHKKKLRQRNTFSWLNCTTSHSPSIIYPFYERYFQLWWFVCHGHVSDGQCKISVSYTHLTLPTIYSV